MGRSVTKPKKHIISCRIDELEMTSLKEHADAAGLSISELLRQCIEPLCEPASAPARHAA
ncbi:MAG: hydrogen-dependent growth transcriptional repressor [Desulfuromonadales bacterium]|nr:hydrogen-dependent growth transcriptional repressor [Desulfuromonadales bacterium]